MKILLSSQVRELDSKTISRGIASGFELMERAGSGAALLTDRFIKNFYPDLKKIIVLAGKGNNGGDGFVLARILSNAGYDVSVCLISEPEELRGDAAEHFKAIGKNLSCEFRKKIKASDFPLDSLIVDAILGTGLSGAPKGKSAEWIEAANQSGRPIIALDIPSGLNSDTGEAYHPCIKAVMTITFGAPKRGLFDSDALSHTGILEFAEIGIPEKFIEEYDSELNMLTDTEARQLYPKHPHNCNKFSKGFAAVIAGSGKFSGAAALSASSAVAAGTGFVTLLYPRECEIHKLPNAVVKIALPSDDGSFFPPSMEQDFFKTIEKAQAICVGPGIGASDELAPMLNLLWHSNKKLVFDADALNIIARKKFGKRSLPAILTPHEGEFKRLLCAYAVPADGKDRFQLAKELAALIGNVVVLKGPRTVIASPDGKLFLNPTGSSALASAGTGDVLSGIITSFCAQGLDCFYAAVLGAYIHGRLAVLSGKFHLASDELIALLRNYKFSH